MTHDDTSFVGMACHASTTAGAATVRPEGCHGYLEHLLLLARSAYPDNFGRLRVI